MLSRNQPFYPLLVLSLLVLSGWPAGGHSEQEPPEGETPPRGFRVEQIEQKRTEVISWVRVQVLTDTDTEKEVTHLKLCIIPRLKLRL